MTDRIIRDNDKFQIAPSSLETFDTLPKGNYMIRYSDRDGFYLTKKEEFQLPSKLYGDFSTIDRWEKSFESNKGNMGIILSGEKGTGKTIEGKLLCSRSPYPVLFLNEFFEGPDFINILTSSALGTYILFIDEFEKIYNERNQEILLSLMDGVYNTKILFILTTNEYRISEYLINRLNRVKYLKVYSSMEKELMNEVIDDMLVYPEHKNSIIEFFDKIELCTMDLLVNLIKEINLFNENALVCGRHLNIKVAPQFYKIVQMLNGIEIECESNTIDFTGSNEITKHLDRLKDANLSLKARKEIDKLRSWEWIDFKLCKIERINDSVKKVTTPEGNIFIMTKQPRYNLVF